MEGWRCGRTPAVGDGCWYAPEFLVSTSVTLLQTRPPGSTPLPLTLQLQWGLVLFKKHRFQCWRGKR
ncbi:hypothetical protein [Comamonas kerstersii]|uniref:hypothetical protein n=1 Tax=Comamonas kerstersii TaxID=225992 RepID=UPI00266C597C|nr:hypothetical protein [Comamonas kerstersii]